MTAAFLSGAFMMGLLVAGLVFLRSWRETRDPLFWKFALAFWLMAIERIPLALLNQTKEPGSLVYLLRLIGFLVILEAIRTKWRGGGGGGPGPGIRLIRGGK